MSNKFRRQQLKRQIHFFSISNRYLFLLTGFIFCAVSVLYTPNLVSMPKKPALEKNIEFEQISLEEGLSQSIVEDMLQDSRGFLWFCTEDGLNRYDGYKFTEMRNDPDDPNSLSHNHVISILEDREGMMWIGTFNGGLNRYDPIHDEFIRYQNIPGDSNSLSNNVVRALYEDKSGILWIGTDEGLNIFDRQNQNFIRYQHNPDIPGSLSHDAIRTIYQDTSGLLWIGTDGGGLNIYDVNDGKFIAFRHNPSDPNSLSHNSVRSFLEDKDGNLWIGTYGGGLNKVDYSEKDKTRFWESFSTLRFIRFISDSSNINAISNNRVIAIYEDRSGMLWMGTEGGGLNRYDQEKNQFYSYKNDLNDQRSISSNFIYSIYEDKAGVLWIGTYGGGLNKVNTQKKRFTHYKSDPNNPNSLSHHIVWSIYEDDSGMLWIGTHGGGLNKYDRQKNLWTHYLHDPNDSNSLSHNAVRVIHQDRHGIIWIGTNGGGINKFDKETGKFVSYMHDPANPKSISHNEIRVIFEDSSGNLWIGTQGGGLNRFNRETNTFLNYRADANNPNSLSNDYVRCIYEDRFGVLWVGTLGGGLNRFDSETGRFTHYKSNPDNTKSISHDHIFSICEDGSGVLWISTWGGGLNKFDREDEIFKAYKKEDGLPDNEIYEILEDDQGNLWLSSNYGLIKFDPITETFKNYTEVDGLQSNEFNGGSSFKSESGEMFFGGINGFNSFFPEEIVDNPYIPPIMVTSFFKFNKEVDLDLPIYQLQEIKLSHKDYFFSFEFTALDYTAPKKNRYAYMLEGLDREWIYTDASKRFASYTTLPPGSYVFRVKGTNNDGVWNDSGTSLKIIITPPYWQSWWFRSMMIFVIILSLLTLYRQRIKRMETKGRALEERVEERTKAAEALQDALDEVENLKNRLHAENIYLQDEIKLVHNFKNIITCSEALKQVLRKVEQVAATDATVLILGESGTGKELLARAIHSISDRGTRPLVKVNCSALPANLIESDLFGHEKGAFTGAISRKIGRFELADGGTIFLDEIGDLPLELQSKLLRVLQEGEFERLGNPKTITVDVRVIAATNRNLQEEADNGRFRQDLFYRLNVFPIEIPPLRERKEDLSILIKHFVKKYSQKIGKKIEIIPQYVFDNLQNYHWPGNVRELENVIERAVIISQGNKLVFGDWLPKNNGVNDAPNSLTLEDAERKYITQILEKTRWQVSGENGAAKVLGINAKTLESRMKKLNIQRQPKNS